MRRPAIPTRARSCRPSSDPRPGRRHVRRRPRSLRRRPTTRRRLRCGARRRAGSTAWLLDEALLLEPRGRDSLAVSLVDGDLLVHVVQLALRELRADRVQETLDRAVVLLKERVSHDRRDVVRELQVLVVIEKDEALGDDARVTREEEPDVDLLALERRDRQRATRVERLEIFEGDPVGVLEAELAERPRRALGGPAEHQCVADRCEVTELLQVLRTGCVLCHDEAVLIGRRREVEDGEGLRIECFLKPGLGLLRIGGRLGDLAVLVHEGEERREVLGVDVDLARLDGRLDDLAVPEVELPGDRVAVRFEYLAVQLAERELLVEVRGPDRDRGLRPAGSGAAACGHHHRGRDERGKESSSQVHVGSSPAVALSLPASASMCFQYPVTSANAQRIATIPGLREALSSAENVISVTIARRATRTAP